jgi:branched-chain amino acid transport system ATP-binding protein
VVGALVLVPLSEALRSNLITQGLISAGLVNEESPGGLPIGERKKLEMARVLATMPELLLLDEVMGGLNPAESEKIIQLILEIKSRGITQMVIEHDMKTIMRVSDRIVVLNSGEKLAEGTPADIVTNQEAVDAYLGEIHA